MSRTMNNAEAREKWRAEHFETQEFMPGEVSEDADFIFRADNTFYPFFSEGQYISVKKCDSLKNGEFGAVLLNGKQHLKFYRTEDVTSPDGNPSQRIVLHSVNPSIPPITVGPDDELVIFGKVIA